MPQGFKNSPAVFQRYMDIILREVIGKGCLVYIDDILIYGEDEESHDKVLNKVEKLLNEAGLKVNPEKSVIKQAEIIFLGHKLKQGVIIKLLDNKEGVEKYPVPKNKKQIQEFLGLVNYYRKFIKNIAGTVRPIYNLLKKDEPFTWTIKCQKAFENLKKQLVADSVLRQPDYSKPFILETDASEVKLGAVLSQKYYDGIHPIAYASRTLALAEKNYGISERECLAIQWGLEHFKYYVWGIKYI